MTLQSTQVCIIGAGPAGLLLAFILKRNGIDCIIIERQSREALEKTIKAGVLEHPTVELLKDLGLGERMMRDGAIHHGFELAFGGQRHRIDLTQLTDGKFIIVYPQHEVIKDLIAANLESGIQILFEAKDVTLHGVATTNPILRLKTGDEDREIAADFIAGCDGFHGPSRQAIPPDRRMEYTRTYPCGWFGILCEAAPSSDELIYAQSDDGFALISTRTPSVQRMYFQCDPDDDVSHWSDNQIWDELQKRVRNNSGWRLKEGKIIQKNIVAMRNYVCETMQYGRLFLAGDSAHIVPPTGAKGLNLAVGDAVVLSRALIGFYKNGDETRLINYSETALNRIWRGEQFSSWMTDLLHDFKDEDPINRRFRRSQLELIVSSRAASTMLAENYVGLPFAAAEQIGKELQS
jgi:p-hydroxybenzoate 3-monooxygenase